ncbi:MAG TPA: AAA family ATPase, partial [Polyangiaceae bacterium]
MKRPRYASSFVGRQQELAALGELVARGERLVSLVGFAGVGKTRLALVFAGGRAALYCDLSAARSTADLCDALAQTLDLRADAVRARSEPLAARIGEELARRDRPLLVLDNFEQLGAGEVATLDAWRERASRATFLVTSRRPLGAHGEVVLPVAPLADDDALQLFLARAVSRLHGANALEGDPRVAASLVDRLDGIPLAIELAAARLDVLSITAIADGLGERFGMLKDPLSAGERHGTLWRAIDWSWRLLEPWQRAALAQLSVFEASFGFDDVAAVVALPNLAQSRGPDAPTALDAIHALVRQSLVWADAAEGTRFSLFEAVRDFATHQLDLEETRNVRRRHARWFLARGREAASAIDTRGSPGAMGALDRDRLELTGVLRRALAVDPATPASARDAAGALLALSPVLAIRGSAEARLPLFDAAI